MSYAQGAFGCVHATHVGVAELRTIVLSSGSRSEKHLKDFMSHRLPMCLLYETRLARVPTVCLRALRARWEHVNAQ